MKTSPLQSDLQTMNTSFEYDIYVGGPNADQLFQNPSDDNQEHSNDNRIPCYSLPIPGKKTYQRGQLTFAEYDGDDTPFPISSKYTFHSHAPTSHHKAFDAAILLFDLSKKDALKDANDMINDVFNTILFDDHYCCIISSTSETCTEENMRQLTELINSHNLPNSELETNTRQIYFLSPKEHNNTNHIFDFMRTQVPRIVHDNYKNEIQKLKVKIQNEHPFLHKLKRYIMDISQHKRNDEIDFLHGFRVQKNSKAERRKISYHLAMSLLNKAHQDRTRTEKELTRKSNIDSIHMSLFQTHKSSNRQTKKNPSIEPRLNKIIKRARKTAEKNDPSAARIMLSIN